MPRTPREAPSVTIKFIDHEVENVVDGKTVKSKSSKFRSALDSGTEVKEFKSGETAFVTRTTADRLISKGVAEEVNTRQAEKAEKKK